MCSLHLLHKAQAALALRARGCGALTTGFELQNLGRGSGSGLWSLSVQSDLGIFYLISYALETLPLFDFCE